MQSTAAQPVRILLVEDNPADRELLVESARQVKIANTFHHAETGEEALAFLSREGDHADARPPDLVLLDLGLPGMDGQEVVQEIRSHADPTVARLPIVILTSSRAEEDVLRSYDLGANAFVTKPVGLDGFAQVLRSIDEFWFTIVKLPPSEA